MYGMMGGMFWGALVVSLLLLGYAYIIWILAAKESGGARTVGQIIAVIVAVLAVLILLYSGVYGGMMGRGAYGGCSMHAPGMMRQLKSAPAKKGAMTCPKCGYCVEEECK